MAMPAQVRKQSEAVAKLYEELNTDSVTEVAEGEEVVQPEEADSETEEAPASQPTEHGQKDNQTQETAEQRYRTLQGMYNADTARLRAENQQLSTRLTQIEQLMSTLSAQPTTQIDSGQKFVTEQDVEDYGDSVDLMRRVTREETLAQAKEIEELRGTLRQLQTSVLPRVEQVVQNQAHSAEQSFWAELGRLVPDWRDINADQGFHSWLLEVDPLSGLTRQTFLDNAQRSQDARRVAQFFETWQGQAGQSVAQTTRHAAASQLEKQVSPGKGRSGSTPSGSPGKTYNPEAIAQFYADVRQGRFKGKDEERARIERDIFAAQREGRITNG